MQPRSQYSATSELQEQTDNISLKIDLQRLDKAISKAKSQNMKLTLILIAFIILSFTLLSYQPHGPTICKYQLPIQFPAPDSNLKHLVEPQHHDSVDATFNYPTVGIPEPGNKFNFTKVEKQDLKTFDEDCVTIQDTDCEYTRYGNQNDGGYVLCRNFFNQSEALINIGIQGRDSLGCELTSEFRMPNYQYDCTNDNAPYCSTNEGSDKFYHICVGQKTQKGDQFTFLTLQDMVKRHNLTGKHWSLKIDIEGGQNQAFKYFPESELKWIDQIIMEVHLGHIYPEEWGMLDIYRTLAKHFVVVNFHQNNMVCNGPTKNSWRKLKTSAIETALVNKRLIKLKSESRSFVWHPLNTRDMAQNMLCP